jgi:photosynthetic reaction center H subunit
MFRNFTPYIDITQLLLYVFWFAFFALILYLRREDKREGYPLASNEPGRTVQGFPAYPGPKEFIPTHPER